MIRAHRFATALHATMPLATYFFLAFFLLAASAPSTAQEDSSRAVRVVVPTTAGGSSDTLGRLIAEKLRERTGQSFVIDNRPGAGQMIGAEHVAKAAPDGQTLLFLGGTYTTSAALRAQLPFDPVADLTGVAIAGEGPFMLVVHASLPVKSTRELVAFAKARPGRLHFGSAGVGSITHLVTELFAGMASIRAVHVPYKSGAPAATELIGGHLEMMIGSLPLLLHHTKSGRIRALAVTSEKRSGLLPALPSVAEEAVPGFKATQWWGMMAPSRLARGTVARLNREINAILVTDDIRSRLAGEGAIPVMQSPESFTGLVQHEITSWRKIARDLKITPQ